MNVFSKGHSSSAIICVYQSLSKEGSRKYQSGRSPLQSADASKTSQKLFQTCSWFHFAANNNDSITVQRKRSLNKYFMIFSCRLCFICQNVPRARGDIFSRLVLSGRKSQTWRHSAHIYIKIRKNQHLSSWNQTRFVIVLILSINRKQTGLRLNSAHRQRLRSHNLTIIWTLISASAGKGGEAPYLTWWQKVMWHFQTTYSSTCAGCTWCCCVAVSKVSRHTTASRLPPSLWDWPSSEHVIITICLFPRHQTPPHTTHMDAYAHEHTCTVNMHSVCMTNHRDVELSSDNQD